MGVTVRSDEWEDPEDFLLQVGADPNEYHVLGLDPGGTTGWCVMGIHPDAMGPDPDVRPFGPYGNVLFWSAGEFTGAQDKQLDEIVGLADAWPYARLVTEDFKLRQLNAELSPVEINAVIRYVLRPRYWVKQPSALAMAITDDRLRGMGFWVPGKEHARDAVRQVLTFVKRQKERAVLGGRRAGGGS